MDQRLITALSAVDGTILHLGAGEGRELNVYLQTGAEQIVLVEPDPDAAHALRLRTQSESRVKVIEAAVASKSGTGRLHRYSIHGLSALHSLKPLPSQWPGLREIATVHVKKIDMAKLLEEVVLAERKQHWLVVETPGEEEHVLQALSEQCTAPPFAYLSLAIGSLTPKVEQAQASLREALDESGYRLEHVVTQAGQLVFHARADKLWQTNSVLNAELDEARQKIQELKEQTNNQVKQIAAERKKLESFIKREVFNATKQIEAFSSIQAYLNSWERAPDMHGWPISSDFALYLIDLLESKEYDLVIEFGSGSSTLLIAKALSRLKTKKADSYTPVQAAFEHLDKYYEKTISNLYKSGLAGFVNLERSPLELYVAPNGMSYNYYSCNVALEALAKRFLEKKPKILLVVDGPPAATGKHARYPALPIVMEWFSQAEVDIILDDYIRSDEKEIVEMWLDYIRSLGRKVSVSEIKMEKDACFLSISH